MQIRLPCTVVVLAGVIFVGCGAAGQHTVAGAHNDASVPADTGPTIDGSMSGDASLPTDGGSTTDGGSVVDGGSIDAGADGGALSDPCQAMNGGCDANATCDVSSGAVTCTCKQGYMGDGQTCALETFSVTPSGDMWETISPSGPQTVAYGETQAFMVTANSGYALSPMVGGTCPSGVWSGATYTTGAVTASCSVSFSAAPMNTCLNDCSGHGICHSGVCLCDPGFSGTGCQNALVTVSASGDGNEAISPSAPQTIASGATQAFMVISKSGFEVSPMVGGTCPAGVWSGATYTTGAVTANCSVTFSATPMSACLNDCSGHGICHSGVCLCEPGFFGPGCEKSSVTVSATGDGNEAISPSAPQTITSGATQTFMVLAKSGYAVSTTVGGTCPAGIWSGATYTTGAITASCSVTFSATPMSTCLNDCSGHGICHSGVCLCEPGFFGPGCEKSSVTVSATGDGNEAISPSAPQTVASGATQAFMVLAKSGYAVSTTVGGTCPAGIWSGATYTTGAVTVSCSVTFSATPANMCPNNCSGHGICNSGVCICERGYTGPACQ